MRSIVNSCLALAVAAMVTACAATQEETDVTVVQDFRNTTEMSGPSLTDENLAERYAQVAETMSNGSVQVFDLEDGRPPAPMPIPETPPVGPPALDPVAMPADAGGAPAMNDPNVMVYPFPDDGFFIPPPAAKEPPPLRPPAQARPPLPSPFVGEGESTPLPEAGEPSARIHFNHGQTVLDAGDEAALDRFASAYRSGTGVIRVEGHASARAEGRSDTDRRLANLKISMDRAMNVSRALIRQGVPAPSIATIAYGDARPAIPGNGLDTEAASRRVEVRTGFNR